MSNIFSKLGEQLRGARLERSLSQAGLAIRVGRDRARITEFERDLQTNRLGRDRLTLLADICDALDLVVLLVPRARAQEIGAIVEGGRAPAPTGRQVASMFDELFVDLDIEDED